MRNALRPLAFLVDDLAERWLQADEEGGVEPVPLHFNPVNAVFIGKLLKRNSQRLTDLTQARHGGGTLQQVVHVFDLSGARRGDGFGGAVAISEAEAETGK